MFSPAQSGANAYARVGIDTGVMGSSPYQLVALLYQGARRAIAQARMHLVHGNVPQRGRAISHAMKIIENGLQASLNRDSGGEIAERLNALYGYMLSRLLEANIQKSDTMLVEVDKLLATLEEAWTGIGPEVAKMGLQPGAV